MTRFLNIFCGVAHNMCNAEVTPNLLFNWWKNFKILQHGGFDLQFAFDHLYGLAQLWIRLQHEFRKDKTLYNYQLKIHNLMTDSEEHVQN